MRHTKPKLVKPNPKDVDGQFTFAGEQVAKPAKPKPPVRREAPPLARQVFNLKLIDGKWEWIPGKELVALSEAEQAAIRQNS